MPSSEKNPGKLVFAHQIEARYVQRAAIVAILAFLFFLAMLVAFLFRQHFGYLILAAAFFVVNIFTLIGFMMQRRNVVKIFENGLSYGKTRAEWQTIESVKYENADGLKVVLTDSTTIAIPKTISGLSNLAEHIKSRIGP
ncbi:MAG: hypothetical protein ACRD6X_04015 [Pyrinomonadaceae bacterium]